MPDSSVASRSAAATMSASVVLAVPAQLHPPAEPRVQRQQRVRAGVVEHERRAGDVTRHAFAQAAVGAGGQERQHGVPQRVLAGIGRRASRSTRRPPSRAGSLAHQQVVGRHRVARPRRLRRDSRSRWRPTAPSRRAAPSSSRTRSAAKMVEPIQQLPTPRTASATSSACTAAPTATVNMVCSAAVRAASG